MKVLFGHLLIHLNTEIKSQFKNPSIIFYSLLFFISSFFISFLIRLFNSTDLGRINFYFGFSHPEVFLNSAIMINFLLNFFTFSGIFIAVHIFYSILCKDHKVNVKDSFHLTNFKSLLVSRFLISFLTLKIIFLSVGLGIFITSLLSLNAFHRIGENHLLNYLLPYLLGVFPNFFVLGSIFFFLNTITKNKTPLYWVSALWSFIIIFSQFINHDEEIRSILNLMEPLGMSAIKTLTQNWTTEQQNTQLILLKGPYLYNRLLWMAVGIFFFFLTLWKASPKRDKLKNQNNQKKKKNFIFKENLKQKTLTHSIHEASPFSLILILVRESFLELREFFKSSSFLTLFFSFFFFFLLIVAK